jgi:hypothetical protein
MRMLPPYRHRAIGGLDCFDIAHIVVMAVIGFAAVPIDLHTAPIAFYDGALVLSASSPRDAC